MQIYVIEWFDPHTGEWNKVHEEKASDLWLLRYDWGDFNVSWRAVGPQCLVAYRRKTPVVRVTWRGAAA
jgi:hypothetical protein